MDVNRDGRTLKLRSVDGSEMHVSAQAAFASQFLRLALEESEIDEMDVPKVDSVCLAKIVEFLVRNHAEPMENVCTPLKGNTFKEALQQKWYRNYVSDISKDRKLLFKVAAAANHMDIKPLRKLICLKMTFDLVGKDADHVRSTLRLDTMTSEQETEARKKYKWIFEES